MRRLSLSILSWTECLKGVSSDGGIDTSMDTTPASSQPQHKLGGTPELGVSCYRYTCTLCVTLYIAAYSHCTLFTLLASICARPCTDIYMYSGSICIYDMHAL